MKLGAEGLYCRQGTEVVPGAGACGGGGGHDRRGRRGLRRIPLRLHAGLGPCSLRAHGQCGGRFDRDAHGWCGSYSIARRYTAIHGESAMFELSAIAIVAGSMFGQQASKAGPWPRRVCSRQRPRCPWGSLKSRRLPRLRRRRAQPLAPAPAAAAAPAPAPPPPRPAPVAPAPKETDLTVLRSSESGARLSNRVAAFWFVIPGR